MTGAQLEADDLKTDVARLAAMTERDIKTTNGDVLLFCEGEPVPCCICRTPTNWFSMFFEVPVCCEACDVDMFEGWAKR